MAMRGLTPRGGALALVVALAALGPPMARADCAPRLNLERTALGQSMLDLRCACACRLDGGSALEALIRARFGAEGPPGDVVSLHAGRLAVQLPALAAALSRAAAAEESWDAARAWSDPGYANGFVRDLLNRQRAKLLGDLEAAFAPWRIRPVASGAEKVLMAVPADLPWGARLLSEGADPARRLPFDAQVWFRLERR